MKMDWLRYHRRGEIIGALAAFGVFGLFAAEVLAVTSPVIRPYDSYRQMSVVAQSVRYSLDVATISFTNPNLTVKTLTGVNADCKTNCTVRPLKSYVDEAKAFAGINGTYFCPADYASCASERGSFFWMVLNYRNRTFINRSQNKFNQGPMFTVNANRQWQFTRQTKDFIPETMSAGVTAAISNDPLLVFNGKVVMNPNVLTTKQREVKSNRSGLGVKGTNLYLVVARKATVVDLAYLMRSMGMRYAMNLDGGGSSALWYRGEYKAGPGRNIPNALLVSER